MKNFKEMLDKDLDRTFYNTEEFAELQRVRIDGIDRNVPVIFDSDAAEARRQMLSGDHAQGIYQKLLVVRTDYLIWKRTKAGYENVDRQRTV